MVIDAARLLFIVVNYRRASLCLELAARLAGLPGADAVQVMIVDNGEDDGDSDILKASPWRSGFSVATPPHNLGFYGGAAFGLETYVTNFQLPDWIIVSNPDITFPDNQFLNRLFTIESKGVGVLAPDIRLVVGRGEWLKGVPQNPFMEQRPSRARMFLLETILRIPLLYQLMVLRKWVRTYLKARDVATAPPSLVRRHIYAPHGSLVIFARNFFERGGHLAHGAFLYGEEIFVAEELRSRELSCVFEPQLRVSHVGGATTKGLGARKQRRLNRDAVGFLRKRYF